MKTLKKTLSVLVVLAMLLAFVPTVYAAGSDGQKTTYDISSKKLVIKDNMVIYDGDEFSVDPDGYIITGTCSTLVDNQLSVENTTDGDFTFDLVFQDLTLTAQEWSSATSFTSTKDTCLTVNIEVKGNNEIKGNAHPGLKTHQFISSNYIFNITVSGTNSLTLYDSKYPTNQSQAFSSDGSVKAYVNGVEITSKQTLIHGTHSGTPLADGRYLCSECGLLYCPGHTGGTQTCKGYKCSTCGVWYGEAGEHADGDSDGRCDGCLTVIDTVQCDTTVTVKSTHYYIFTPEISGWYRLSSNSSSSSSSDPYVYMYFDSYSVSADDNGEGYNFILDFYAVAETDYCFYLSDYWYNSEASYTATLKKIYKIEHQPTAAEPYVKVNYDDNASYQWSEYDEQRTTINLDNASVYDYDENESSSYTSENGWSGVRLGSGDEWLRFFKISVDSAATVSVISDTDLYCVEIFYENTYQSINNVKAGEEYFLTIDEAGTYYLDAAEYSRADVNIKASFVEIVENTNFEDETNSVLQNPTFGKNYSCAVTFEDGTVLESKSFKNSYAITHQPTSVEPFVEVNIDNGTSYQWYEIEDEKKVVDTTNASVVGSSSYSEDVGWTGDRLGYWLSYFKMSFEVGDKISFVSDKDVEKCELYDYDTYRTVVSLYGIEAGKEYTLDVGKSGNFVFDVLAESGSDVHIKASISTPKIIELENETASSLQNMTLGKKYFCAVTPTDTSVVNSDSFVFKYDITHQPTAEEAYVETNDENAEYQWYSVNKETTPVVKVTDKIACPDWSNLDITQKKATYDENNGWKCTKDGYYFVMYLNVGDTVKLSFSDGYSHYLELYSLIVANDVYTELHANDDDEYVFTALVSGYYGFKGYSSDGLYLNAQYTGYTYTEIDEATEADFASDIDGLYACEVLFSDETSEMSNIISLKYVEEETTTEEPSTDDNTGSSDGKCEHICHHTNPVSKFFWKIICYFFKLLNISHYCPCGAAHY